MKSPVTRYDCVNKNQADKKDLLRIVKKPDGTVDVDPSGKANGRGCYLKADRATLEKAIKTKAIEKSLKVSIPASLYEKIARYIND